MFINNGGYVVGEKIKITEPKEIVNESLPLHIFRRLRMYFKDK